MVCVQSVVMPGNNGNLVERVTYRPIGLLARWPVVRVELRDASVNRLVACFHRLLFVHAIERWDDGGTGALGEERVVMIEIRHHRCDSGKE